MTKPLSITDMQFITIDTLQFSNRMQKAGMKRETAEELAEAIKETQLQSANYLATSSDIIGVKNDIIAVKSDLIAVKNELKKDMELMKKDIIIKLGGALIFSSVLVAGFLSWFLPLAIKIQ